MDRSPGSSEWQEIPHLATGRLGHCTVQLLDGRLLVIGGSDINGKCLTSTEVLSVDGTAWTAAEPMDIRERDNNKTG